MPNKIDAFGLSRVSAAAGILISTAVALQPTVLAAADAPVAGAAQKSEARVAVVTPREAGPTHQGCRPRAVKSESGACVVEIACAGGATRKKAAAQSLPERWWSLCEKS